VCYKYIKKINVLERLTIQDWKLKDQIAELENAGMEKQTGK